MKKWIIPNGSRAGAAGLQLVEAVSGKPGAHEVKISVKAWSTNFRDGAVANGQYFSGTVQKDTVPLSDGAGVVVDVGPGVTQWKAGDRVAGIFFQNWQDGDFDGRVLGSDLGGPIDGMLAEEVILREDGIVAIPDYLSLEEGATLPCAAVTAWNALFHASKLRPGDTVLTLGTGGVSVFAIQMAAAAGMNVIATSSSDEKLEQTRALGASRTINYRAMPDWDAEVLRLTGGRGVDTVIEVGGPGTLPRSLNAVRPGGTVALIGVLADSAGVISPLPLIGKAISLQGVYVGSRAMFEAMNRFLNKTQIRPVVDRVFSFDQAPMAYARQASGKHLGKVVISLADI